AAWGQRVPLLALWRPGWGAAPLAARAPGAGQTFRGGPRLHRLAQKMEGGTDVRLLWNVSTVEQGLGVSYRHQRSHALHCDDAYYCPQDRSHDVSTLFRTQPLVGF